MLKEGRLFIPVAPPPRPVVASAPRPISTVSEPSDALSVEAENVIVVAVGDGPVKTTEALPLFRLLYATPAWVAPASV